MNEKIKDLSESQVNPPSPTNYWKLAFLGLLAAIIGGIIFIGVRLSDTREVAYKEQVEEVVFEDKPSFQLVSNKEDLNRIINHYLTKYLSNKSVNYEFYLENQALLNGTFKLLGFPVEFYLYFEPFVMSDGNVMLEAKSVSIGSLNLPMTQVLKQVAKMDLPEWVEVKSKEEQVILHLNQLEIEDDIRIKADKINLIDDDIRLSVYFDVRDSAKKEEN
ncbi:YpmS family protein [Vagococcus zengguangii]|uniref:YpmS family protein n=1 Tax=Vagococcus zengguangii TaxID=2571750 RepID=UPI0012AEEDE2|nr:YpmS family protein [Vagococcus zengguangii]